MSQVEDEEVYGTTPGGPSVVLPSGIVQPVMNLGEKAHLEHQVAMYHEHNALTNIADLTELDRLLILELRSYRIGNWLGRGSDYLGEDINEKELDDRLNRLSTEIRLTKKTLGLDRPARERAKGEGSVAHYWENLRVRAQAFGVNRNNMSAKSIELSMRLIALIQVHDNAADLAEQEKLGCTVEDIMSFIRDIYTPEMMAIDEHFRTNEQTYWIRSQ